MERENYTLDLTYLEATDVRGAIDALLIRLRTVHGHHLGEEGFAKIKRLEEIAERLPEDA